jgi:pyruvate dehydrogenase E1 component alpha subunit
LVTWGIYMVKKVIGKFEVEYLQVLDETGKVDKDLMPKLTPKQIKDMYTLMVLLRTFDDKSFSLQRQGRIGTYIQYKGQEASQLGSAYALEDKDWMFPMYRSGAALIVRKHPMHMILQYNGGDIRGLKSDDNINNFPISIPVGTQTPHAVGCAWASKLKGEKVVSLVYTGEGGTSRGDFHDGLNFAGLHKVPCIIVVENNQYAISVPRKNQTASETFAQKAIAYGIKGIQVDGNDVFAVYKATKEAVDNARAGNGPTLIENLTYRRADHSTSDDAKKYRSDKEVQEWAKKDPITRLEKYMKENKLLDDKSRKEIITMAKEKVEKEVKIYENLPAPTPKDIFDNTYKEYTPDLQEEIKDFEGKY